MKRVAIATDSDAQMTRELAQEHNIRIVPLHVIVNGRSYLETDVDLDWFYKQMPGWKSEGGLPTTSGACVGDFLEAYHDLRDNREAVLAITLSSKFSETYSACLQAKKAAEKENGTVPFEVVDSLTACGAQMLIVIEASRVAAAGGLAEVAARVDEVKKRANYVTLSDDLYYLAKGGRVHDGRVWASSKVTNTVLLEADYATGGVNKPLGRYKTRRRALEALLQVIRERSDGQRLQVAINHADSPLAAEELKELVSSQFRCSMVYITPMLPLVTVHNGLGTLKCSWLAE